MTAQVSEKIIIAGEELNLLNNPLKSYIEDEGLEFLLYPTACSRGYLSTWELKDNTLYLVDFKGNIGTWNDSEDVDMNYLFPNAGKVKATWFTGKLGVLIEDMVESDYALCSEELEFDINRGNLTQILHKKLKFKKEIERIKDEDLPF